MIVYWDGAGPVELIAAVEARLAAGHHFAVLATTPRDDADKVLLAGWQEAACKRLAVQCRGWAEIVPGADIDPARLALSRAEQTNSPFPLRAFADRSDAAAWLRNRLTTPQPRPPS